mmetsp:Transcript_8439/g.24011  ORF Transcript_8439/g.24011 Transcript_8439/m.24011 type:complete len:148 (+) Transcript_8439:179-622(+)
MVSPRTHASTSAMRGGRLHPRQLPGCKRACASWSPCVHRVHRQQPRPPLPPSPRVHKRGQGDLLHDWLEPPSLDWEDLDLGVSLGPPVSSKKPPKAKPTKVAAGGGGVNRAGLWWGEACGWRACQATCQEKTRDRQQHSTETCSGLQ